MIYSEEELNELCKEWQKILRLQDWKGKVYVVHCKDIDCIAFINPQIKDYTFEIKISDEKSLRENKYLFANDEYDMMVSLVHELLHLHFECVQPKVYNSKKDYTKKYLNFDRGIELTAQALVNLYRKNKKE